MAGGFLFGSKDPLSTTTQRVRYGRGGAGNVVNAPSALSASQSPLPPSSTPISPLSPRTPTSALSSKTTTAFFVGVGGAGNIVQRPDPADSTTTTVVPGPASVPAVAPQPPPALGYHGRGGAGNVYSCASFTPSPSSYSLSSQRDSVSGESSRSSFTSATRFLPSRLGGRKS